MINFYCSINRDEIDFDSTPIDISEIISICKEYSSLGFEIQSQIDYILENGFKEAVKFNKVNLSSIIHIKDFLQKIANLEYLGDAAVQANDSIKEIDKIINTLKRVNVN